MSNIIEKIFTTQGEMSNEALMRVIDAYDKALMDCMAKTIAQDAELAELKALHAAQPEGKDKKEQAELLKIIEDKDEEIKNLEALAERLLKKKAARALKKTETKIKKATKKATKACKEKTEEAPTTTEDPV